MKSFFYFWILSVVWGSAFILMKGANLAFGPVTIAALRTLSGGLSLLIIGLILKVIRKLTLKETILLWAISLFGNVAPFTLQPFLIKTFDNSALIGMMVTFVPLLTIVSSIPLLKIFPSKKEMLGVFGGLMCMLILFWDGLNRNFHWYYLLMAFSVPVCYSISSVLIKKYLSHIPPLTLSALNITLAGLTLLPFSLFFESPKMDSHFYIALLSVSILGILCTGIATYWFFYLIKHHGALQAGLVSYVIPCVALIWGWIFGESITFLQVMALLGTIGMVALVRRDIIKV